jgi:hypothetical protein
VDRAVESGLGGPEIPVGLGHGPHRPVKFDGLRGRELGDPHSGKGTRTEARPASTGAVRRAPLEGP